MTLKRMSLRIALIALVAPHAHPQTPKPYADVNTPHFRAEVCGGIAVDFRTRIWSYFQLRSELKKGLPVLKLTNDPAEIGMAVRALATRIRMARVGAKEGDFFTPTISAVFRKTLFLELDASSWAAIMDDNPGEFSVPINGSYPEGKPFSTMPPSILAILPTLPDDIEYRFLGRHLILLDTEASVILDRIPYAIQPPDSDGRSCLR